MNARIMTVVAIGSCVLTALVLSPQISAQPGASQPAGRGIFGSLRVGSMVELKNDEFGMKGIFTYDDEARKTAMKERVKEIGNDYIVLELDERNGPLKVIAECRIPAARVIVLHFGKTGNEITPPEEPLTDKPAKSGGKAPTKGKK
ncbi:MAG: hypothetical protein JSS02_20320 [Planctomycetes bacterium]|nr:hypothetical protein [Planctomycetota bacterium]